jgi:hypothetical protein
MQIMREPAPDVVITKQTFKGKELVLIDDDAGPANTTEAPYIRKGQFRLMDLPAELRVYIYQFLLPYNMVMTLKAKDNPSYHAQYAATRDQAEAEYVPEWNVVVTSKHEEEVAPVATVNQPRRPPHPRFMVLPRQKPIRSPRVPTPNHIQTQLFVVSKVVSLEARGKFSSPNAPLTQDTKT